jgi:cell division protein FtsB
MPPFFRPKPEPPRQSWIYEIRDKLLGALAVGTLAIIGALASIAWNVDFLVRELPKRLENLHDRQTASEREIKGLQETDGRIINVQEKHDSRLSKLEGEK